jgi:hypothetical protein
MEQVPSIVGELREEFVDASLPDWRLRERLMGLASELDRAPEESLPRALKTTAAREAAYRFLGNRRVTAAGILAPHMAATVRRAQQHQTVYVVSDTTEFSFSGERGARLGRLQGDSRGFLGHFALVVSADGKRRPLGMLGMELLVRSDERKHHRNIYQRKKDPERESLRWSRMVERSSAQLANVQSIHVMDSEADTYELLTDMTRAGRRFIVRAGQDRLVDEEEGCLSEAVANSEILLEREVALCRRTAGKSKYGGTRKPSRRHGARAARLAHLRISCRQVSLKRPKSCTVAYPSTICVNVVRVFEPSPPDGQVPVEWQLLTTEPIATAAQVAAVVDGYRTRWLIEEYFKAIKTGCAYESRQLESLRTLSNFLAIIAVLAWRLLLLRAVHRGEKDAPASDILGRALLEALAERLKDIGERKPLPLKPSVDDALNAIARLGGHIKSNGVPGWQVLWRGYQDLLTWGGGYIRGKSITCNDQW